MLPSLFTADFLRRLELLKLKSKRKFSGIRQGKNLSLKRGHGIEFSDYREYQPGDNPRYIDWALYGRSDRMYVKTFHEERNISVFFIVDASASMRIGQPEKWNRTCELVIALSYIALSEQEEVSIAILGDEFYGGFQGMKAVHQIADRLRRLGEEEANGFDAFDPEREVLLAVNRISYPGICVFLSDFFFEEQTLQRIFQVVHSKNLETTVIQLFGERDRDPLQGKSDARIRDSETGQEMQIRLQGEEMEAYQKLLSDHTNRVQQISRTHAARHTFCSPEEDLLKFMSRELERIGLITS